MRGTWVSVTTGEQSFLDFSWNSGFQFLVVSHLVFFTAGEQSYLAGFQLLVMSRVTLFFYCWWAELPGFQLLVMSRVTRVSFNAAEQSYLDSVAAWWWVESLGFFYWWWAGISWFQTGDEQSHLVFILLVSRVSWISVAGDEQSNFFFTAREQSYLDFSCWWWAE
jgi:hypothetical protein